VAAWRFCLGHKTSAGETLWTWLTYLVAFYASSIDAPPADRVLACLLLWSVWLPVGDRWSLDALARLVRPAGETRRPPPRGPAAGQAVLGFTLQTALILIGLAAMASAEQRSGVAWLLGLAALAAVLATCVRVPAWLRNISALVLFGGAAMNVALHAGEAWAWTLLAAPLAFVPDTGWELINRWLRPAARPVTCYFDDDCGICQAVCRTLTTLDRGNITFIGNYDSAAFRHAVPLELTERTIVVFDESGRMKIETRAVAALLAALPWPWRAGALLGLPGVADLADFGYRWVARNRLRISVQLGLAACGTGVKPAPVLAHEVDQPMLPSRSAAWAAVLLALMLLRAYNANLADALDLRTAPEPRRLHALLQVTLFDQEWSELGRGVG
jgi:predicted DCC family thiol-disulfide oxidoreductase YuxK